ncbi:MAG TPA: HD domain-containing protein [Acidimicrobiales bacterium]|nr:HD domain-containing protein [Acidimicrobiales bacterium]
MTLDDLLARYDGERANAMYDEVVTEREHALQAALLAEEAGADDATVAAALLHDVGRLLVGTGPADRAHDRLGERVLAELFGPEVTAPVGLHVAAKRFLCATEPAYAERLSAPSVRSLAIQGGPMGEAEVAEFRARPHSEAAVRLRRWDDEAKVPGRSTPRVDEHRALLEGLLVP